MLEYNNYKSELWKYIISNKYGILKNDVFTNRF